ncbi:oligoribonuclease [Pseudomonas aeruginosa]|uniref:oligoribonuclease n=1 Tax=Pseudomonas aeruginosa TaxID=287 RepID=UPI0010471EF7|nr:oligoribonuclease [Pseudomonas aeruginosa]
MQNPQNLIWIDLEMTGLDPDRDVIMPICGNSICQDRRFLYRHMPRLEGYFHYRNLDVSTLKELAARWAPQVRESFKKGNTHLALDDIRESIAELRHYRDHFIKL